MPVYFIETIIDASRKSDEIGTIFHDAEAAMKVALWAIIDIVNDESEIRTELDVTVVVKDLNGDSIFNATIQSGRRFRSEIRSKMPVVAEPPPPRVTCPHKELRMLPSHARFRRDQT